MEKISEEKQRDLWKNIYYLKYQVKSIHVYIINKFIKFLLIIYFKGMRYNFFYQFKQQSQLDAVHHFKYLEWIPFENFQNVTYVAKGGFGKIYSAVWPEGYIRYYDIENKKWKRYSTRVALKSLDNSSELVSRNF